jgi:hypothetical protein
MKIKLIVGNSLSGFIRALAFEQLYQSAASNFVKDEKTFF